MNKVDSDFLKTAETILELQQELEEAYGLVVDFYRDDTGNIAIEMGGLVVANEGNVLALERPVENLHYQDDVAFDSEVAEDCSAEEENLDHKPEPTAEPVLRSQVKPNYSNSMVSSRLDDDLLKDPEQKPVGRRVRSSSAESADDSVAQYLREIGRIPLLNGFEEERELAKLIEAGELAKARQEANPDGYTDQQRIADRRAIRKGDRAREKFVEANLRLVVSIARRYPRDSIELLDAIQEGNLGLNHAVTKFDYRKGFKFSTYATFWIRQSIGRAIDQKSRAIRLPGDVSSESRQLHRLLREGYTDEEAQSELGLTKAQFDKLKSLPSVRTSLDREVSDEGDIDFYGLIGDPEAEGAFGDFEDSEILGSILEVVQGRISAEDFYILELRFGLFDGQHRSYSAIGKEFGVTAEAMRRHVKRIIETVQMTVAREGLRPPEDY